jgi:TRAP-type transport system periplasmic protein
MQSNRPSRRKMAIGGTAALASIGLVRAPARAAQYDFILSSSHPIGSPGDVRGHQMSSAILRESGGRLNIKFFAGDQLGTAASELGQLRLGAIQMATINTGTVSSMVPVADLCNIGFVYKDADEAERVMDGPVGAYMRREIAAKDLIVFSYPWDNGMFQLGSNSHPIRTPDDLAGFKIRTTESKVTIDLVRTFGAVPVTVTANDVYVSLQTKLMDGETAPLASIMDHKWYEVNK